MPVNKREKRLINHYFFFLIFFSLYDRKTDLQDTIRIFGGDVLDVDAVIKSKAPSESSPAILP